ncbi:MAG: aminomethyltransferase family protein [Ardenticatenaceae bacterium]|nr:aminomethyltransferase family protein [Ardenticatenaceae bacterium]
MVKKTPFFARTGPLNETMLWEHWAGYLVAQKYQYSELYEYYSVRNSAGLFDSSPLFKYQIKGADAADFLRGVLARDIGQCPVGRAQYTIWCDDHGWILEDGVVLHVDDDEYWLTAAEPNLRYFQNLSHPYEVTISDISEEYGLLALQGPHSRNILKQLTPDAEKLAYFELSSTQIAQKNVVLSRTGYTGDLGYEIWVNKDDALAVWDALMEAGSGYNITPFGQKVLHMARIDAGLILIDVEYHTARHAWVDEQRSSPIELGFSWMFRGLQEDSRPFIGRRAIENELVSRSSRWHLVGIEVDWQRYENLYNGLGLIAPKDHTPIEEAMALYDGEHNWVGHTTSFMFSSVLKKHVGLAKVAPYHAKSGSPLQLELVVNNRPLTVAAKVVKMPFYNPARKTA